MAERLAGLVQAQQVGEAHHDVERAAHLAADGAQQPGVGAARGGLDRPRPQQTGLGVADRAFQVGDAAPGDGRLAVLQPLDCADAPIGPDRQPEPRDPRRQAEGDRQ
ncbi:hypothetical protein D3C80_1430380 [compost metagenome]